MININGRAISPDHSPYIIAELSANHNGSLERALKTIEAAHKCGVDAIKIQTYTAETLTIDCDAPDFLIKGGLWDGIKLHDLYKWAETPYEWHQAMFDYAKKLGITIFSTPFDETAVDLLEDLGTPTYKIASFEIVDLPLIRYAASTGKPMIMSTGMASEEEIEDAVTTAREAGCKDLILLHCISSYPAPIEQANLRQIPELARRFGVITGLSDHTMGTTAGITAVALGACIIEKHFTLSRQDKGPDSEFSLEPHEMERLCVEAKDAWSALGTAGYTRKESEEKTKIFRRSVYFVRDLAEGAEIARDDIRAIRPGKGLAPKFIDQLIGLKTNTQIQKGTATSWDLISQSQK
ncbi:pseudaminic acid synthase [Desulfomicrobium escambiense]|uniref:pseudaminic acid synthase n=1 Tax=Desulfomicrobium escambiense TaxID=29503 RepID=UPI0004095BB5|nr:pseudaminic acid synthase [Desulfomicrobium escambiense]